MIKKPKGKGMLTGLLIARLFLLSAICVATEVGKPCGAHEEALKQDEVEIRYGLIRLNADYIRARAELFPNANSVAYGGCRVNANSPKRKNVHFCAKCRDAESKWREDHKAKE